jgi:HK97 family phage portal protein
MPGFPAGRMVESARFINPYAAENLSTVLACVQAISSALAALPAGVYRQDGKARIEDREHPLMALIQHGPNQRQTWPDLVEFTMAQVLLWGNALIEIVAGPDGRVVELRPVPWVNVSVQLLPSGRLAYDVYEVNGLYGGTDGRRRRLLADEVVHLRDRSNDGLVGVSRLQRAFGAVKTAFNIAESSNATFENGCYPSGVISTPATLNREQRLLMQESYSAFNQGPAKTGRILIMDQGMNWQRMTVNPVDAQMLESRRFSSEELCRVFQVPPPLVQDYTNNTFTNSEQAGRWFSQFCLLPWVRKLEAEFNRSLFAGSPYALELDLSAFDRGDSGSRWAAHKIAVEAGILTPAEVREVEGWNPRPDQESV